jgi:hypothetical protein
MISFPSLPPKISNENNIIENKNEIKKKEALFITKKRNSSM